MSARAEALAALADLPDASMSLIAWWRDDAGELVRPCTRKEVRAGILAGTLDPADVLTMARIARLTEADLADMTVRARRQRLRAV